MLVKSIFLLLISAVFSANARNVYVTYGFSAGRFGDNLTSYAHAKWIAYQSNSSLLYRPFLYSDKLALSQNEVQIEQLDLAAKGRSEQWDKVLKRAISLPNGIVIKSKIFRKRARGPQTVFLLDYFPVDLSEEYNHYFNSRFRTNLHVDWNDPGFKEVLLENIRPLREISWVPIDNDAVNIAVHFRRGTGFDPPEAPQRDPLKIPPLSYITTQLQQCARMFFDKKLFVYLFTDYDKPLEVVTHLQKAVSHENISYGFNEDALNYTDRTLDDFFSMMRFNCIIRSGSNFSTLAAKLSRCCLEISPKAFVFGDPHPIITEVVFNYDEKVVGDRIQLIEEVSYEDHAFTTK
jgi:hypothetical protein